MKEISLKKRYIVKLLSNFISGVIGAIIIAIVPKALGPVMYGQFIYLQEFFLKIIGFLDMGSSIAFFTKLSAKNSRKELITFYFLYAISLLFVLIGIIYILQETGYISTFIPNISNNYIYMGLFFGLFTWFSQIFIKISDAYALTVSVEIVKIIHKIASLVLLLFLINGLNFNLNLYYSFHYISFFSFLLLIGILFVKKDVFTYELLSIKYLNFKELIKEFIVYCHPLVVYNIIGLIAGFFDIWLLQKIAGSEQTGFYGLSYSLAAMCFLFTSAMTPIITREFSKSYEEKDLEKMKTLFYRYIPMLYSIAAFFAVFISVQSENVLDIFTDEKFKEALLVLMVMSFYPIHQTYGQLSGSIFYATGQTELLRNISFVIYPLGMIISFIFISLFDLGALGLAYKMVLSQFVAVNIQLYFNSNFLNLNMKYFLFHQFYALCFFAFIAIFSSSFISFSSSLFSFLTSGLLYTVLVIIFAYIFPQVFALRRDEIKENLKNIYKRIEGKN